MVPAGWIGTHLVKQISTSLPALCVTVEPSSAWDVITADGRQPLIPMLQRPHYLPDIIIAVIFCVLVRFAVRSTERFNPRLRRNIRISLALASGVVVAAT